MDQASSRVRGFYMADELRKKGIDCDIAHGLLKYLSSPLKLSSYEMVYFQKCYLDIDIYLNKLAGVRNAKTIFDIDDAPFGVKGNLRKEKLASEMMKNSSAVTVGSRKLKDFAQKFNKNVYHIPTSINLDYYKPVGKTSESGYITLGWIGYGINYKTDLQMLIAPLENLGKKYDIKLIIIGAFGQREIYEGFGRMKNIKLEIIDSLNWADPLAVPSSISRFDIGLYPLLDTPYNQYKCGFKALEYMAMEVPVVASPAGENKFLIESEKDGLFASTKNDWESSISRLIENKNTRENLKKAGRKKIEDNYSTRASADKLLKIFEETK